MRNLLAKAVLPAVALLCISTLGDAQIERLTLDRMVARADHAVQGRITARDVFRVDHPIDGPELYFTKLTVQGKSCYTGNAMVVEVVYHGGFLNETEGVYNSEAPADAETAVGRDVVVFYKWADNLGGDVAGNALFASHGGLFPTVPGVAEPVVLGRGDGYAIRNNVRLSALETQMRTLRAQREQREGDER